MNSEEYNEKLLNDALDSLSRSLINSSKNEVDNIVEANVHQEATAGIRPKIIRSSDGKCCAWCSSLAGEYYADEAPDNIYRRHDNCSCTVTYESA